jgi:calcium binding protein 39
MKQQDLLTRHKSVVAQFLADRYQPFFEAYEQLLKSSNYVTRRQSLKVCACCLVAAAGMDQ